MACSFEAQADTKDALMSKVAEHAKSVHSITTIPLDLMTKIQGAVRPT